MSEEPGGGGLKGVLASIGGGWLEGLVRGRRSKRMALVTEGVKASGNKKSSGPSLTYLILGLIVVLLVPAWIAIIAMILVDRTAFVDDMFELVKSVTFAAVGAFIGSVSSKLGSS